MDIFAQDDYGIHVRSHILPLHEDAGIDGNDVVVVGQEGIDVNLLDFGGEAQEGGQADDDFGIALLVDALLTARTLQYLVATQRVDHAKGLVIG